MPTGGGTSMWGGAYDGPLPPRLKTCSKIEKRAPPAARKSALVDAAPVVVEPTKSATKPGNRGAVEENLASAKKHKKDVLVEQKVETKFQKNIISKKEETETSEDTSSEKHH